MNEKLYLNMSINMYNWFKNCHYKGVDPYLLDEKFLKFKFFNKFRYLLKPLHSFIPKKLFSNLKRIYFPKALGLIIAGNSSLYKITSQRKFLNENYVLLDLLKETRSKGYKHFAWGWPFEWGTKPRYPKNIPLVCVTSPIAHSLIDFYNVSRDRKILKIIDDVCLFFIEEVGYKKIDNNLIAFYYDNYDYQLINNSIAYAAAVLARAGNILKNKYYLKLAEKAVKFLFKTQNPDGSWNYYCDKNKKIESNIIDNRHTAYMLENLEIINKQLKINGLSRVIKKGYDFYIKNFFDGYIPKWSIKKTYPVDIHDVANSIIAMVELGKLNFAEKIIKFAINKMSNKKDEFYYKYFANGSCNKNIFIRWNQAWMFRAITFYLEKKYENSV